MTLKVFIGNAHEQYGLRGENLHTPGGRFEQLSAIPNPIRRMGAQAIDAGLFASSIAWQCQMNRQNKKLRKSGIYMIGQGYESVVYLDESTGQVTKYATGSIRMTDNERTNEARRKQGEFDLLHERLGSFIIGQSISVGPYVLSQNREVIQTSQPFLQFSPFLVPEQNTPNITYAPDASSIMLDQLSDFIDGAWELEGRCNLLPDTNGPDNVVTDMKGNLILLDTQPIGERHPEAQETIKAQLETMSKRLAMI